MSLRPSSLTHDPNAVLDYVFAWGAWLAGDTITNHEILLQPADGLTIDDSTHDDTTVTVWLSGGTVGQSVKVTCRVTTTAGRTDDRTLTLTIRNR